MRDSDIEFETREKPTCWKTARSIVPLDKNSTEEFSYRFRYCGGKEPWEVETHNVPTRTMRVHATSLKKAIGIMEERIILNNKYEEVQHEKRRF